MSLQNILARLQKVKQVGPHQYQACCPAHDDKQPSLSIKETDDGKILLHCHKGCAVEQILNRMGLPMSVLFPDDAGARLASRPESRNHNRQEVAAYPYTDEQGNVLAEKVRYEPKSFAWRTQKGDGKYDYHKPNFVPPYNLPCLHGSPYVFLVEGEKDVDMLTGLGIPATSLPDGAMSGKWPEKYTPYFSGKRVVIIPDNDDVGKAYGASATKALRAVAPFVGTLDLTKCWPDIPEHGDITDYILAKGDEAKNKVRTLAALTVNLDAKELATNAKRLPASVAAIVPSVSMQDFFAEIQSRHPVDNKRYSWSDNGSGRLFADLVKAIARFVPERKMWFRYEGRRWVPDVGDLQVMELCKTIGDALNQYALGIQDEEMRKKYQKYVRRWLDRSYRSIIIKDAASIYPISMTDFDADRNQLNCVNGTLDLQTLQFRPHNADDKITKLANVSYAPEAKCLRFDRFVEEVMSNDKNKSAFLQKALGYALSGDTQYECMFFLYGATTRNGKSTLMESVLRLFGDYGRAARPETIASKQQVNGSGPNEDIARLAGIRFLNIPEPQRGLRLNAAQVKSLTGNDSINARYLHENSFDFRPQCKLYVNTNYLPAVDDMSLFSSGRIHVIPFERHFNEDEQETGLKEQFSLPEAQSAILNWLIEGYRLLKQEGLRPPAAVAKATAEYSHDSDKLALFAEDELIPDAAAEARTAAVYERYKEWCKANGYLCESDRNFKRLLLGLGDVVRKRPHGGGEKTTLLIGYRLKGGGDA